MTWRVAACAALFLAAIGCSSQNQSSSATPSDGSAGMTPAATASPGGGVEVSGKLSPGLAPGSTFITLELRGNGEVPVKSSPAVMDQVSQTFLPAFLVAQAGQRVEFRNSDDVLHNIRVTESSLGDGLKKVYDSEKSSLQKLRRVKGNQMGTTY